MVFRPNLPTLHLYLVPEAVPNVLIDKHSDFIVLRSRACILRLVKYILRLPQSIIILTVTEDTLWSSPKLCNCTLVVCSSTNVWVFTYRLVVLCGELPTEELELAWGTWVRSPPVQPEESLPGKELLRKQMRHVVTPLKFTTRIGWSTVSAQMTFLEANVALSGLPQQLLPCYCTLDSCTRRWLMSLATIHTIGSSLAAGHECCCRQM